MFSGRGSIFDSYSNKEVKEVGLFMVGRVWKVCNSGFSAIFSLEPAIDVYDLLVFSPVMNES